MAYTNLVVNIALCYPMYVEAYHSSLVRCALYMTPSQYFHSKVR